jgi:uncharacterized protein YqeY
MKAKESERLMAIRNGMLFVKKKLMIKKSYRHQRYKKVVMTLSKQLQEGFDQAKASGRSDIAAELKELKIYKEFQPEMMSPG